MKRRFFFKNLAAATVAASYTPLEAVAAPTANKIQIQSFKTAYEKEMLKGKFGFKGNYLTELWQIICLLR